MLKKPMRSFVLGRLRLREFSIKNGSLGSRFYGTIFTTQAAKLASANDQLTKLFRKVSTNFGRRLR